MSVEISIKHHAGYVHVAAQTRVVNKRFLNDLIDTIEQALPGIPQGFFQILLEVTAPKVRIDLIEAFEVWKRASEKGIQRTQIAYVVKGRPISPIARVMETVAQNRGIQLRFFKERKAALEWLCPGFGPASERTTSAL